MKARIVRLLDISARDEQVWKALSCCAEEPNPFLEPDCLVPAAHHLRFGAEIDLVLAEEGDRAYACIPIRALRDWRGLPYPFVTAQATRTLDCGTPLVDTERSAEGLAAILSALSENRCIARSRVLVLPGLNQGGPVFDALRTAARMADLPFIVFKSSERGFLRRRPEAGCYERLINTHRRAEFRRTRRRLTEELGTEPVLVDRTADPTALQRLLHLEGSQGYKAVARIAMTTQAGESEYFGEICRRFASSGRLHLLSLEAGDQTLAMSVWLRGGRGVFVFKVSYNERYARYGPGALLHVAGMEYFHKATDADWIDTCTWRDNKFALRLYPDRRQTAGIFIPLSRNPLDRVASHSFMALRPIHKRIYDKRHPQPSHADPPRPPEP